MRRKGQNSGMQNSRHPFFTLSDRIFDAADAT
jgi:hypothetical protein